jgi:hypothetical protein
MLQFDRTEEQKEASSGIMMWIKSMLRHLTDFLHVDPEVFPPQDHGLTAEFSRDKMYL